MFISANNQLITIVLYTWRPFAGYINVNDNHIYFPILQLMRMGHSTSIQNVYEILRKPKLTCIADNECWQERTEQHKK